MHPEPPGRYINSVSDLYETDEIEFLLDDIRELEPVSCKPEDIQVTVVYLHFVCLSGMFCFLFTGSCCMIHVIVGR